MTAGPFVVYNSAKLELLNGTQDWVNDNHRLVLLTSSYTPAASHSTWADLSAYEVTDTDYDAQDMTGETISGSSGTVAYSADVVSYGSSVTITARYAAIVCGTVAGAASGDKLVGYFLLDDTPADVSRSAEGFRVNWASAGIFTVA